MKLTFHKTNKEKPPKRFSWNPIHPRRDWQRLLISFIVLLAIIGLWSGYLFYKSEMREATTSVAPVSHENENAKQIERIEAFFEKRK